MTLSRMMSLLLAVAFYLSFSAVASAEGYIVTLRGGNTFSTREPPSRAPYDNSKVLVLTDQGNLIALSEATIESITSDLENRGFGAVIDTKTIFLGKLVKVGVDFEAEAGGEGFDPSLFFGGTPQGFNFNGMGLPGLGSDGATDGGAANVSSPLFAEPSASGGGIPLRFVGSNPVNFSSQPPGQ